MGGTTGLLSVMVKREQSLEEIPNTENWEI